MRGKRAPSVARALSRRPADRLQPTHTSFRKTSILPTDSAEDPGELYGSAIETRFAKDFLEVRNWIEDGPEPETVNEASFRPDRLDTMRTRLSAAYKGVHALLMRKGAQDLRSGQTIDDTAFWDEDVDIHHISPRAWCTKAGIDKRNYDTVVNKTPLTRRTNQIIGGDAPSRYLSRLVRQGAIDDAALDECLGSHVIDTLLIPVKPITRSGGKPITCSGANRSPVPTQTDHLSERSDAGRNHESRFSVRVDGRLRFRIESPFRSSLYALCTRRSRIALASVGSPMTSCHLRLPPISRTG